MNAQAQRIAIGTACGWVRKKGEPITYGGVSIPHGWIQSMEVRKPGKHRFRVRLPDYLNDLNACAAMEATLTDEQRKAYYDALGNFPSFCQFVKSNVVTRPHRVISATAAQRAEAFLRTLGKWEDAK